MGKITLKNIHKNFGETVIIPNINLEINEGEFVVFVGPSGCGKSTLLRMISGLEDVSKGTILINDEDVTHAPAGERGLAMVFQSYALYPHMSVRDNIAFPLKMAKVDQKTIDKKVMDAATSLNLLDYLERKPGQLSGGQRQRVAIGRAIVRKPTAFLFDEPLSNLDAALRGSMRLEIAQLHDTLKTTMIYVTHDQVEAMTLADKIVVFNKGNIEQVGSPLELYRNPANLFVAGFLGSPQMNFIKGEEAWKYKAYTIGIRPENIAVSTEKGMWKGEVLVAEHLGSDTCLHIKSENLGTIIARVEGDIMVKNHDIVYLTPDLNNLYRFDENGKSLPRISMEDALKVALNAN